MANDLPLSMHWTGFSEQQLAALGLPITGGPNRQLCRCMIIANLVCAHHSQKWVSYSRDRSAYVGRRRYNGPAHTYRQVTAVVDELERHGLIQHDRAWPGRFGWRSRMKAGAALLQALLPIGRLEYRPREVIHLKDSRRRLIGYSDTSLTRQMRREVCELNEAFRSVRLALVATDVTWRPIAVHIDNEVLHPAQVACYRIFNGGWQHGGRLYGPFWQTLSKQRRLQLTMDGADVIEHDFAQLHPRLLYAARGCPIAGDAYTILGYEGDRAAVKRSWQILINAASRRQAVLALAEELGGFHRQAEAAHLLDALEHHHRSIAAAFYTGIGLRLQRLDSDLMMGILLQCLGEGIIALPVHDSLVVPKGPRADRAYEIMHVRLEQLLHQLHDNIGELQK
jgi:hypothetical protein